MNDCVIIIPARYSSGRFPGKPLAILDGCPVIIHVCRNAAESGFPFLVATDDLRIAKLVESEGFNSYFSDEKCENGTERVWKAYKETGREENFIIDLQADEPFIKAHDIKELYKSFSNNEHRQISTIISDFDKRKGFEALFDADRVKVTKDHDGNALYFSRSIIPYVRNFDWKEWIEKQRFFIHRGIYIYTPEILKKIVSLPPSSLEIAEGLEQLRWIENGIKVNTISRKIEGDSIDKPEDLKF